MLAVGKKENNEIQIKKKIKEQKITKLGKSLKIQEWGKQRRHETLNVFSKNEQKGRNQIMKGKEKKNFGGKNKNYKI